MTATRTRMPLIAIAAGAVLLAGVVVTVVLAVTSGSSSGPATPRTLAAPARPPAGSAPRWSAPRTLGVEAIPRVVRVDSHGRTAILNVPFERWELLRANASGPAHVLAAQRPGNRSAEPIAADFALDGRDRPIVVWEAERGLWADID